MSNVIAFPTEQVLVKAAKERLFDMLHENIPDEDVANAIFVDIVSTGNMLDLTHEETLEYLGSFRVDDDVEIELEANNDNYS